jgi:hypothetical protein
VVFLGDGTDGKDGIVRADNTAERSYGVGDASPRFDRPSCQRMVDIDTEMTDDK